MSDVKSVFNRQKEFFNSGKTNDINFRIDALKKLKQVIKENEDKILDALKKDLGKSNFESYATEVGLVYEEINTHIKNIKRWSKIEKIKSPIVHYPAKSYIYKEPYGATLIIGPFNYPFQLVIAPLVGAISAGNTAIIKPSENTKNTSILLEEMINSSVKDKLLKLIVEEIHKQFGKDVKNSPDYPRVVNTASLNRLKEYINDGEIYYGGNVDSTELYMEPTILTNVDVNSNVMTEEIFGPILPVIEFDNIQDIISFINKREKPLALYYFSENKKSINNILRCTTSGGVTINDTVIHVANGNLPFGGVGNSGMGSYHGKASFDAFTHKRSVMERGTFVEFNIRFAPYKEKINILKKIMK